MAKKFIHRLICDTPNIGNIICLYFDKIAISFEHKIDFKAILVFDTTPLIDTLPNFIKYEPIYDLPILNRTTPSALIWETEQVINIHRIQPLLKDIIRDIIPDKLWEEAYIDEPILFHFRASDGPMNRHEHYHMLHYSWYEKILNMICENKFPDI